MIVFLFCFEGLMNYKEQKWILIYLYCFHFYSTEMSFNRYKDFIEEGDTVILYINPQAMYAIQAQSIMENRRGEKVENVMQTKYGALKISSLFGKRFGSKVNLSNGWAYVLYPTPELWTQTLPHRTQIIYTPDISLIMFMLELKPGSIVIESGNKSIVCTNHICSNCIILYFIRFRHWKWFVNSCYGLSSEANWTYLYLRFS